MMSSPYDVNVNMNTPPMATAVPIPFHSDDAPTNAAAAPAEAVPPMAVNEWNDAPDLRPEQLRQLEEGQGFPRGLAAGLGRTRAVYPIRFWVVDNSGSMQTPDGHQLRHADDAAAGDDDNRNTVIRKVPCTRWVELQGALTYHIQMAGLLEATTLYRFLNRPGRRVGPREFRIGGGGGGDDATIPQQVSRAVTAIQNAEPRGVTPLTSHLNDIHARIRSVETALRRRGQEAVVVLATDGLPSNDYGESDDAVLREFLVSLKALQTLPVWIVVRLCTDDARVVSYYNSLDNELELPLEVIDDFFGEAKEIHKANRWLTYGLPLHRCREMGYHHRIFDLLDERLLNKDELLEFVKLLFGPTGFAWTDPHADFKEFCHQVEQVAKTESNQFNPYTQKMEPWIDVKQLKKCYGGGFRLFGKKR